MKFSLLLCALCLFLATQVSAAETIAPTAAAKDVVERWLSAQNRGAFADYESLYAPRFTGVRRSGSRVVRLDRKGWLQDRGRMFQRPMKVEVADSTCTAKVKGFALLHRVDAYAESMAVWQGKEPGEDGKKRRASDVTIAREAWSMGEGSHLLLAELELPGASCGKLAEKDGSTWARAATVPPLQVLKAQDADAAWKRAALAQARKLPEYAKLQTEYEEEKRRLAEFRETPEYAKLQKGEVREPHKALWEDAYDEPPQVRVMERGDGSRLLSALLTARGGCAEFGATLWAVWDVKGGPGPGATFKLLLSSNKSVGIPASAVDIDGDGREELLTGDGILRRKGERLGELEELQIPSFICPC